jgi:hypothetical protein
MSKRDLYIHYRHMLDHAREAVALAQGKARSDLDADRTLNLALARLLYESTEPLPGRLRRSRLHRSIVAGTPGPHQQAAGFFKGEEL